MSDSQSPVHDEFYESLLGDFLDESGQLLDRLNENLLALDEWVRSLDEGHRERCDDALMNEMFRSAHSLKGLSAMLGLKDINSLTHKVENVFDAARKDQLFLDGDIVELIFQAVDRLVNMVEALKDPSTPTTECDSVIEGISHVLQAAGAERKMSTQADAEKALEIETPATPAAEAPSAPMPEAPVAQTPEAVPTPPVQQAVPSVPAPTPAAPVAPAAPKPPVVAKKAAKPTPPPAEVFLSIHDEAEVPAKYLAIFIDEAELSLDSLSETLLTVEGGGRRDEIESLMITSHRIKGSAASVGLNRIAKLAHFMEDRLQEILAGGGSLSAELIDAMLKCTDGLRHYVGHLKAGTPRTDRFGDLATELENAARPKTEAEAPAPTPEPTPVAAELPPAPAAPSAVTSELRSAVAKVAPEGMTTFVGVVTFREDLQLANLKARLIFEKLFNHGGVCYFDPPAERLDDIENLRTVSFGVTSDRPREEIEHCLRVAGVEKSVVELLGTEEIVAPKASRPAASATPAASAPAAARPAAESAPTPAVKPAAPVAAEPRVARPAPASAVAKAEAEEAGPAKGRGDRPTETLRVDIDRLDQLMNLAGQLVINKARFAQLSERLKGAVGAHQSTQVFNNVFNTLGKMAASEEEGEADKGRLQAELDGVRLQARRVQNELESVRREMAAMTDVRVVLHELVEAVHQLDRVTDGIQRSVMDTRMVPIGPLFGRFKRVVRDITRTNGKQIRLVINGEKTELDKRMIDELGDPLIHMVRNSADHGVETPEVREAAGKPREGVITLDAFHRGNSIVIQVTDDGKGLDADRILRKAVEKGLLTEADGERMTKHQIYNLIWEPGLSTAEKVTEVSGRGMGMDIVKSKIEDLNGTIDLDSVPGRSTTITVKLPLTLAILPSLMVDIDGDVFAMPMESVVEIVSVAKEEVNTIQGTCVARVRGRVISVVRLDEIFSWSRRSSRAGGSESDDTTLVIVGERGHEIGLAVDKVLGEEDIVIKSMAENYKNVGGIAGASILGDGRVSLILDVIALLDMASRMNGSAVNA